MPAIDPPDTLHDEIMQLFEEFSTPRVTEPLFFEEVIHPTTASDTVMGESSGMLRSSTSRFRDVRPPYHAARTSVRDSAARLRRQQRLQRVQRPLAAERWTVEMMDDDSSDSSDEYYDVSAQLDPVLPIVRRRRTSINMRYIQSSSLSSSESPLHHHHHQDPLHYCLGEIAVDLSEYRNGNASRMNHEVLDFDIVAEDGGRYSPHHDIDNILRNDCSVYCSNRSGTINVLLRYCGPAKRCHSFYSDLSCVISRIVVKSPQHGYTAPCKEGMVFISHAPIDINSTKRFDGFTRKAYDDYVQSIGGPDMLSSSDPVAWFSVSNNSQDVIDLDERTCKYVLIKLLRAKDDADNIDLQYVAFIGYVGPRAFGSAQLC